MKDNRGSALMWSLLMMLVVIIVLGCLMPMASSSITQSERKNQNQQAYYTAKSVAEMIAEYVASDVTKDPGKSILDKAQAADKDLGVSWKVTGLKDGMGDCDVNVRYKDHILYVKAEAEMGTEKRAVTIKLAKNQSTGALNSSPDLYVSGYDGIRAKMIYASQDTENHLEGNPLLMADRINVLLTGEKAEDPNQALLEPDVIQDNPLSSAIAISRTDANATSSTNSSSVIYSKGDVVYHNPLVATSIGSVVSNGNIAFLNPKNLFSIYGNFTSKHGPIRNNLYPLYSCKSVKLFGQVQVAPTKNANITARSIEYSGRLVKQSSKIPAGITTADYTHYVYDSVRLDFATLIGRNTNGTILSHGPIYITNQYGPTTIQGDDEESDECGSICGTKLDISCTKDHLITITGNAQIYQDDIKIEELDGLSEDEIKEKQKDYQGNVTIDAGEKGSVVIKGNLLAKGNVTLKGNVTIEGNVLGYNVTVEGNDVTVGKQIYAFSNFTYRREDGTEDIVDKDQLAAGDPTIDATKGLGGFVYDSGTDTYVFTRYRNLASKYTINSYTSLGFKPSKTRVVLYKENVNLVVDEASEKTPLSFKTIPKVTTVKPSEGLVDIDTRHSEASYNAYLLDGDFNLGKLNVNSYGDIYLIVGEGKSVSLDEVQSKLFLGNLFLIVKKGGTLRLNDVNNITGRSMRVNVYSEDGGKVVVGKNTQMIGNIDVDQLQLGAGVSFQKGQINNLTGGVAKTVTQWSIIQYIGDEDS